MKRLHLSLIAFVVLMSTPIMAQGAFQISTPADGSSVHDGIAGTDYQRVACVANTGNATLPIKSTWTLSGDVPPGLSVSNQSDSLFEYIEGTLTENTTPRLYQFTLTAVERDAGSNPRRATALISMEVLPTNTLIITAPVPNSSGGASIRNGVAGAPYPEVECKAVRADRPNVAVECAWAFSGSFPDGLEVRNDDTEPTMASIQGQLAQDTDANYGFTLTAMEVGGDDPQSASMMISMAVWPALTITARNLALSVRSGEEYDSEAIVAQDGGPLPPGRKYSWSGTQSLPEGLFFEKSGEDHEILHIKGSVDARFARETPYTITISVTNNSTTEFSYDLQVVPVELRITTLELGDAILRTPYRAKLEASGGYGDYTWSADNLPNGLSLTENPDTKEWFIEGTISDASIASNDAFEIALNVEDSAETPQATSAVLNLTVRAEPVRLLTSSLPAAVVGEDYSLLLEAAFGLPHLSWRADGLPNGLSLTSNDDSSRWEIRGIPESIGRNIVTLTVSDSTLPRATVDRVQLSVFVNQHHQESLTVSNTWLPVANAGERYSGVTLTASGGTPPYVWSARGLPDGIELGQTDGATVLTGILNLDLDATYLVELIVSDSSLPVERSSAILKLVAKGTPTPEEDTTTSQDSGLLQSQLTNAAAGACSLGQHERKCSWTILLAFVLGTLALGRMKVCKSKV